MKGLHNAALLFSTLLSARHDRANAQQTPSCPDTLDGFKKIDGVAFLHYAVVPSDPVGSGNGLLCARLEVDHEGWVGLAFSDDDKMNGSNAIIGVTDEDDGEGSVLKYNLAGYSPSVMPDEKQTLMDTSFYTVDGRTFLTFTKLLVEDGEIPIAEDGMNIFLHARGGNTLAYHGRDDRVVFDVNFASRPNPSNTTDVSQTSKEVCSFCDDGITVDGDHPLFLGLTEAEVDESIASCQQLQVYAKMLVSGSQECNDLDANRMTCCAAPLEKGLVESKNPCLVCPSGITLPSDVDMFDMCKQAVGSAKFFDEGTETCIGLTTYEVFCCPILAANPCSICPEGFFDEDSVVNDGDDAPVDLTCGDITPYIEEGSALCEATKETLKSTCCTALSDPIQALPSPASPEDPVLITNPTLSSIASNVGQDLPPKEPSASAPALPSPTSSSSTAPKEPISVDQPSEDSAVETRPTNKPTNATLSPNTSNDSQDLPSKEPSASRPGKDSNGDSQPSNKPSASPQASQSPTLYPTSAPSSVAPAMGILLSVSLLLVTSHAIAWIV